MSSSNETQMTQDKKPPSKASWLVVAIIVFVLGAVVCGAGSIVVVLFAAALTLPVILSKRRAESGLGVIMLLLCLVVGASIYNQGFGGAYWEYLQRAKVAVAIQWLEQLKSPVETFYAAHHNCPTPEQIGTATFSKYAINLQRSGTAGEKCTYSTVLNTDMGFSANTTLGLAYLVKSNTWSCKNKDTATTQIEPIYLPYRCKD